jgi:hypothetical protein
VVREAGWKFERWNDVAFFQKRLAPALAASSGTDA